MLTISFAAQQRLVDQCKVQFKPPPFIAINNPIVDQGETNRGFERSPSFSPEPEVDHSISSSPEPTAHKNSPQHDTKQDQNEGKECMKCSLNNLNFSCADLIWFTGHFIDDASDLLSPSSAKQSIYCCMDEEILSDTSLTAIEEDIGSRL